MISQEKRWALQQARSNGIGRLMLLARRKFLSHLKKKMAGAGGIAFSRSSGALLPFIDLEGTRSSELARRAGISKQAVAKGVRELEAEGLLTRLVDSADARAALVCFTERGIDYLLGMHQAISDIETEYDVRVGKSAMDALRATLVAMIDDRHEVKQPDGAALRPKKG